MHAFVSIYYIRKLFKYFVDFLIIYMKQNIFLSSGKVEIV